MTPTRDPKQKRFLIWFVVAHGAFHRAKPTKSAHPGSQGIPILWESNLSGDPLGTFGDLIREPLGPYGDPWSLSGDTQEPSREPCVPRLHFIDFSLVFIAFGAF